MYGFELILSSKVLHLLHLPWRKRQAIKKQKQGGNGWAWKRKLDKSSFQSWYEVVEIIGKATLKLSFLWNLDSDPGAGTWQVSRKHIYMY